MAREEDIYRLMDQRDQSLCCTGFCLAAVVVSIYFLMQGLSWERVYFLAVSGIGSILLSWHTWKENRRIMEAGCCYMEIDGESLAVCQPEQDGRYESCRIFYSEVEKIVEGSRKGIPEFYVVVCPDQGELHPFRRRGTGASNLLRPLARLWRPGVQKVLSEAALGSSGKGEDHRHEKPECVG